MARAVAAVHAWIVDGMTPTIFEVAEQAARSKRGRAGKRKLRAVSRGARGRKAASEKTSRRPAPKRRAKGRKRR